jgi:SAM-dependent methyltransferase
MQQNPTTWDAVAPTYAEDAAQWHAYAKEALRLVPVGPLDRVLDVATGPGTLALLAAPDASHVHAVDFSPGMIAELQASTARAGLSNLEARVMDAQNLEFPDASFDAAYCLFGFFFFPDRARAFQELLRVLKPNGRLLIATWTPIERRPFMKLGFDAVAEAMPHLPRPGKGDLQDPAECVREMTDAGFRDVETSLFDYAVTLESPERYLEVLTRSAAPFAVMKKSLDAASWEAAMARVLEVLKQKFPPGGTALSAEAIFTRGVR